MRLSEIQRQYPKILYYGPPGCGKTAHCLTLGERCHYIDLDGNLDVAFGLNDSLRSQRLSVDVRQFLDEDPRRATAFLKLRAYVDSLAQVIIAGKFPYDVLVLDSISALGTIAQRYIMGNSGQIDSNPQIQHWGLILTEIENIILKIKALPIMSITVAHEMIVEVEEQSHIRIAIPGQKLPGKITRMFSEIWYMRMRGIGEGAYDIYIQTTPTATITCRSGRGLKNGIRIGTITKTGEAHNSVSLWDVLRQIGHEPPAQNKETAPAKVG